MQGLKRKIRDNKYLNWLLIISNWALQGIPHSDKSEKIYKISFSLFFCAVFLILSKEIILNSIFTRVLLSFFISHSLNWLVNTNFSSLLIHRLLLLKLTKQKTFIYLNKLEKELSDKNWILYAAAFGSICKGKLQYNSDIDISVVRKPGLKNAVLAMLFSIKEKKYADFKGIPLELFISDSPENSLKRFQSENNPVILANKYKQIDKYYSIRLSLDQAKKLNRFK